MRIGRASVEITPSAGVEMAGYVARTQPSVGVHDPLMAHALLLESENGRLLWLHADVLGFEADTVERVKEALRHAHGLDAEEILLTTTHTHSGPAVGRMILCGTYEEEYVRRLEEDLVRVGTQALREREDVSMVFGTAWCDLAIDRRGRASAHVDPRVSVLGFRRPDGTFAALVANAAVHNVAMSHENRLFSGDMAGAAARQLRALPGQPTVLFTNGACGNLNPPSVAGDFDRMERWGSSLASAALDALENASPVPDTGIRARIDVVPASRPLSIEERERLAARQLAGLEGAQGEVAERCREAIRLWRDRMADQQAPSIGAEAALLVHTVVVNDIPVVGFGGEMFSVIRDELERGAERPVIVTGYADGDCGYVAPETAYDEGGYEVDGAFVFYGTPPVPRGTFERARDTALAQIKALTA